MIPIAKIPGAESNSGAGVVMEYQSGGYDVESDSESFRDSSSEQSVFNYTVYGNVGVLNFDFGLVIKGYTFSEEADNTYIYLRTSGDSTETDVVSENVDSEEYHYNAVTLTAGMKVFDNLRLALAFTPSSKGTHTKKK